MDPSYGGLLEHTRRPGRPYHTMPHRNRRQDKDAERRYYPGGIQGKSSPSPPRFKYILTFVMIPSNFVPSQNKTLWYLLLYIYILGRSRIVNQLFKTFLSARSFAEIISINAISMQLLIMDFGYLVS